MCEKGGTGGGSREGGEEGERGRPAEQNNSWNTKKSKLHRSPVVIGTSASSRKGSQIPLNTIWMKEGNKHPTLLQIAQILCRAAVKFGREEVVLWKTDILLWLRSEDYRLLGCKMFGCR